LYLLLAAYSWLALGLWSAFGANGPDRTFVHGAVNGGSKPLFPKCYVQRTSASARELNSSITGQFFHGVF
jgi:hypothetical protein